MPRFIGNLDLCGQQVSKPCRTSLGFPAVLPHAGSDQAAGICSEIKNIGNLVGVSLCIAIQLMTSFPCNLIFFQLF